MKRVDSKLEESNIRSFGRLFFCGLSTEKHLTVQHLDTRSTVLRTQKTVETRLDLRLQCNTEISQDFCNVI